MFVIPMFYSPRINSRAINISSFPRRRESCSLSHRERVGVRLRFLASLGRTKCARMTYSSYSLFWKRGQLLTLFCSIISNCIVVLILLKILHFNSHIVFFSPLPCAGLIKRMFRLIKCPFKKAGFYFSFNNKLKWDSLNDLKR